MMRAISVFTLIAVFVISSLMVADAFADRRSSDILRSGILGAGAGAVGGAAAGAKGRDVWKGALAGAGVNIIGGALLDSMSGERVGDVSDIDRRSPRDAFSEGYESGYVSGYKKGYTEGYREGLREGYRAE